MSQRTRRGRIEDALLKTVRRMLWTVRNRFFVRPKPVEPSFVLSMTAAEAERLLGEHYFEPNWELSYQYFGEVLNLRRVEYVADHPTGYRWWQVHVRGYPHASGIELTAHFETDPSEYPDAHVDRVGLEIPRGMAALSSLLRENDVTYRSLSPST